MSGLPYYKAYPRDFIEGTIGMPFEVKCTYRVILDLIYMQSGKLPDDARYISGLLGCSIRKWKSIREILIKTDKIQVSGEFLSNYRAVSELEMLAKLQDKQRENRSRPNKNNHLQTPPSNHTEPEPKERKNTKKEIGVLELETMFAEWGELYPKDVRGSKAKAEFEKALERIAWDDLKAKTEQYAELCESEERTLLYIQEAKNWLGNSAWTELPEPDNPWPERLKAWNAGHWHESWGPKPDNDNTQVPEEYRA